MPGRSSARTAPSPRARPRKQNADMIDQRTIRRATGVAAIPTWIGTAGLAIAIVLAPRRTAIRLLGLEGLTASSATCLTVLHVAMRYKRPDPDDLAMVLTLGRDLGRDLGRRERAIHRDHSAAGDSEQATSPQPQ